MKMRLQKIRKVKGEGGIFFLLYRKKGLIYRNERRRLERKRLKKVKENDGKKSE